MLERRAGTCRWSICSLPALRAMSARQYAAFSNASAQLVGADKRSACSNGRSTGLAPPSAAAIRRTAPHHALPTTACRSWCRNARCCFRRLGPRRQQRREASRSFARGAAAVAAEVKSFLPSNAGSGRSASALDKLAQRSPKHRRRLVDACAACICADLEVTVAEAECSAESATCSTARCRRCCPGSPSLRSTGRQACLSELPSSTAATAAELLAPLREFFHERGFWRSRRRCLAPRSSPSGTSSPARRRPCAAARGGCRPLRSCT